MFYTSFTSSGNMKSKITVFTLIVLLLSLFAPSFKGNPLSVTTNKQYYKPGELVVISVNGKPNTVYGGEVTDPRNNKIAFRIETDSDGKGSWQYRLDSQAPLGQYSVYVSGGGETAQTTFRVKRSSSITITLSSDTIALGETVTISGKITPSVSTTVTIEYREKGGSWSILKTVTATNGRYSYKWTPDKGGEYELRASWPGNDECFGAVSSTVTLIVSTKRRSSISIQLSEEQIDLGENITVTGSLNPALAGVTVTINYIKPNGDVVMRTVVTDSNGKFKNVFTPDVSGIWKVYASWEGNADYMGAKSGKLTFKVRGVLEIEILVNPTVTRVNSIVFIYGEVTPEIEGLPAYFEISTDGVSWNTLGFTYVNRNGSISMLWTPSLEGSYYIRIRIPATANFTEAISSVVMVNVRKHIKSIEEYEKELNKTKTMLSEMEEQLNEYISELSNLNMTVAQLQELLGNVTKALNEAKASLTETQEKLMNAEERIRSLTSMQYLWLLIGLIVGLIIGIIISRFMSKRR